MLRTLLFIITVILFPTDFARAVPPPDLIISSTQAIFASLGLLVSSLFVWWTQLSVWLSVNSRNKIIFVGVGILTAVTVVVAIYQLPKIREAYWRKIIDKEVQTLWVEYEATYSADSEVAARKILLNNDRGVTWDDFMREVNGGEYLVVDIREGYGFEVGNVPDSIHMRFGDLVNGEWYKLLPYKDIPIYIVCYVGSTGALTIDFLSGKGFTKLYQPQGGIMQAVRIEKDYPFTGTLEAPGVNGNTHMITKYEFKKFVQTGSEIIDMRAPSRYGDDLGFNISQRHFREFMTTAATKDFLETLDKQKEYAMLCDSELSCYQGEMLYEDLKRSEIKAVGIYRDY